MALNVTTLSAACGPNDSTVSVAAATGISAPVLPVGPFSLLLVDQEAMYVTSVNNLLIGVNRGWAGSKVLPHVVGANVLSVLSTDPVNLAQPVPVINPLVGQTIGAGVTGATITPSVWGPNTAFYFTGAVALATINLPTGVLATQVTVIFNGTVAGLTWVATGNIAVGGTSTTAKSAVSFFWDPTTSKWIPSRLS